MESRVSPCPNRIFDDLGSAFAMGCLGGSAWHAFRGYRNAPKGGAMLMAYQSVVTRAPTLGGNFAVWGGLFSAFDCGITGVRQKEDPLNAIAAGALTGGVLAIRAGPKAAGINALIGGCLLGLIEGLGFAIGRLSGGQSHAPAVPGIGTGIAQPGSTSTLHHSTLAMMQPRRILTSALDDPAEQALHLHSDFIDDKEKNNLSSAAASQIGPFMVGLRAVGKSPVTYASSVDFSTDDFSFHDDEDFEDNNNNNNQKKNKKN